MVNNFSIDCRPYCEQYVYSTAQYFFSEFSLFIRKIFVILPRTSWCTYIFELLSMMLKTTKVVYQ